MSMLLTCLFYICLLGIGIIVLLYGLFMFHYVKLFCLHKCRYCGKHMEYKGLREDDENGHYLFHCEKCGSWEQVPKQEMFKD